MQWYILKSVLLNEQTGQLSVPRSAFLLQSVFPSFWLLENENTRTKVTRSISKVTVTPNVNMSLRVDYFFRFDYAYRLFEVLKGKLSCDDFLKYNNLYLPYL
jgi:hypothetical protein